MPRAGAWPGGEQQYTLSIVRATWSIYVSFIYGSSHMVHLHMYTLSMGTSEAMLINIPLGISFL